MTLIVDGADCVRALRAGLMQARQPPPMIGWNFDFEIEMQPGEGDTGVAEAMARRQPARQD